jgi:UDP-N-acetylglucosamine--dolichyl-phosphate N-acetylglucosaminephosphotransferase
MMAIAYGQEATFNIPLIGEIDLKIIYPLLIIPFIIVFTSNAINIMADFDGLAPGNGLIISIALFVSAWLSNQPTALIILSAVVGAQVIFFFFNKYPAKIFTGNVGTLFLGSVFAVGAIVGHLKYSLLILMIPYLVHFILQQRITWDRKTIKIRPRERGIIFRNGILKSEYNKAYGLTHFIMQRFKNISEKRLVIYLILLEFFCAVSATTLHIINLNR